MGTPDFAKTPVNRFLGFELLECSPERTRARLAIRPELLQEAGVVQGGILTALADTTAVYLFYPGLEDGRAMASIELKLNFLAPALADGGDVEARARVVKRGRRIGLARVELQQGEREVAVGLFTYLFFEPGA